MPDPLDVIAEIVFGHRLLTRAVDPQSSTSVCWPHDCGWEHPACAEESHATAHARHVAEVIRDVLAPEGIEWSLARSQGISYGNQGQCRQTQAVGGGTVRRRAARYWPDEISEWEEVP